MDSGHARGRSVSSNFVTSFSEERVLLFWLRFSGHHHQRRVVSVLSARSGMCCLYCISCRVQHFIISYYRHRLDVVATDNVVVLFNNNNYYYYFVSDKLSEFYRWFMFLKMVSVDVELLLVRVVNFGGTERKTVVRVQRLEIREKVFINSCCFILV